MQWRVFTWDAIVYHTILATLGGSAGADSTTLAKVIALSYLRDRVNQVPGDAMTVFAEALARGVQRHGAVLALYTLPTIYMQSVSVASSRMCHRSLGSAAGLDQGVGSRLSSLDGAFVHANSTSTLDQSRCGGMRTRRRMMLTVSAQAGSWETANESTKYEEASWAWHRGNV